jgi:amidohydrolase
MKEEKNQLNIEVLKNRIENMKNEIVSWRRHFHQHGELSFQEFATSDFIEKQLESFGGIEILRPTKTGVIGRIVGAKPGMTIALRADIDALPMTELNDLPYASESEGVMHSCGHDGHTAILLGIAKLFSELKDQMSGTVVCIFQHAEELPPGGAIEMVKAGVMEGIDEIYGLHLSSSFPTGTFGIRSGFLTAATDRFDIEVIGKGGHSAMPETCVDPIVIGAQIISNLQTIVSRRIKGIEPAVLSVCQVGAGNAYNIIPNTMAITGSVRTFSQETRNNMAGMIKKISRGIASSNGADCKVSYELGYSSVVNDEELTENVEGVVEAWFGKESILKIDPVMPGEDFSAFTEATNCPGCFVEIGTANEALGTTMPHHNPKYMMDEEGLYYGTSLFASIVFDRLFPN